ncbi:hypothetical protein GCM10027200_18050 [Lentzea nigeriaca]
MHGGGDEATVRRADTHHTTLYELTENGLVTGQDADLALGGLRRYRSGLAGPQAAFNGDQFNGHLGHAYLPRRLESN